MCIYVYTCIHIFTYVCIYVLVCSIPYVYNTIDAAINVLIGV